ncbi:MAG: tetratricopeptide repeat protein [Acidimicrobiales bacterium]
MSLSELAAGAVVLAAVALVVSVGVFGARWAGRTLFNRRERTVEELADVGLVYGSDVAIRLALVLVWLGFALGSLSLLPAAVWLVDADPDASRAAIGLVAVGAVFVGIGLVCSLPGQTVVVLEPDRLTKVKLWTKRSVPIASIEAIEEARWWPASVLSTSDGRMRLSRTMAGFDDLFDRLVAQAPRLVSDSMSASALAPDRDLSHLAVSRKTITAAAVGLGLGLVLVLGWPWMVEVIGDNPTRDRFLFMAIGLFMWGLVAPLVRTESFPARQPIELKIASDRLMWRGLRGGWLERPANQLYAASVETTIIYVRGQPGHRHPLRLRFVDGTVVEIGDRRAAQMGTSTHLISAAVRQRCLSVGARTHSDHSAARHAIGQIESGCEPSAEVEQIRRAIGLWPNEGGLGLHLRAGDLLRRLDRPAEAAAHYRAYLDVFADDATAWQALAECFRGGYRSELYDETIAIAEQLLMRS